jgi:hypothetical protein
MSRMLRALVVLAVVGPLALASAPPVLAVFSVIATDLTGPAIGGEVPRGDAEVDQSALPTPGTLDVRVKNVNLPDGTVLDIYITDCGAAPVGTITLDGGKGRVRLTLPAQCQVGHNSSIFLKLGDATILEGGSPWEVRRA